MPRGAEHRLAARSSATSGARFLARRFGGSGSGLLGFPASCPRGHLDREIFKRFEVPPAVPLVAKVGVIARGNNNVDGRLAEED
jgi:hypothetical protein